MAKDRHTKRAKRASKPTLAEQADRHELYERAVQDVVEEAKFVAGTFQSLRGRAPVGLREDFCGTASACCEWVRNGDRRYAIGVDFDPEVLAWGREHRLGRLAPAARQRVKLVNADVREVETDPVDVLCAFNFSYQTFRTRDELRRYFESAHRGLGPEGLMFLDLYGGSEAYVMGKEKTRHDGFTYVWEQASYEPISGRYRCHIHFKFPDGSRLERAFSYEWRLWTLPELRELLAEAGFSRVRVYWELEDEDGEGTGEYAEAEEGLNDPAWIAYVIAEK